MFGTSNALIQEQYQLQQYKNDIAQNRERYAPRQSANRQYQQYAQEEYEQVKRRKDSIPGLNSTDFIFGFASSFKKSLNAMGHPLAKGIADVVGGSIGSLLQAAIKTPRIVKDITDAKRVKAFEKQLGPTLSNLSKASNIFKTANSSLVTANLMKTMITGGGSPIKSVSSMMSPTMMATVAVTSMITDLIKNRKIKKLTAQRQSTVAIERENSLSRNLEGQLQYLTMSNQVSSSDQMLIRLGMWTEAHTSVLPLIYDEMRFQNDRLDKDTARIEMKRGYDSNENENSLGGILESVQNGLLKFNSKYNPLVQLMNFAFTGKTPKAQEDELATNGNLEKDNLRQESIKKGIAKGELRLLHSDSSMLMADGETLQTKMLLLAAGQYDISRLIAKEVITIRKDGTGSESNSFYQGENYDQGNAIVNTIKNTLLNIPGLNAVGNIAKGVFTLSRNVTEVLGSATDIGKNLLLGKEFLDLQDADILKKTSNQSVSKQGIQTAFMANEFPSMMETLRVVNFEQLEVQQNIFRTVNEQLKLFVELYGSSHRNVDYQDFQKEKKQVLVFDQIKGRYMTQEAFEKTVEIRRQEREDIQGDVFGKSAAGKITNVIDIIKNVSSAVGEISNGTINNLSEFATHMKENITLDRDRMDSFSKTFNVFAGATNQLDKLLTDRSYDMIALIDKLSPMKGRGVGVNYYSRDAHDLEKSIESDFLGKLERFKTDALSSVSASLLTLAGMTINPLVGIGGALLGSIPTILNDSNITGQLQDARNQQHIDLTGHGLDIGSNGRPIIQANIDVAKRAQRTAGNEYDQTSASLIQNNSLSNSPQIAGILDYLNVSQIFEYNNLNISDRPTKLKFYKDNIDLLNDIKSLISNPITDLTNLETGNTNIYNELQLIKTNIATLPLHLSPITGNLNTMSGKLTEIVNLLSVAPPDNDFPTITTPLLKLVDSNDNISNILKVAFRKIDNVIPINGRSHSQETVFNFAEHAKSLASPLPPSNSSPINDVTLTNDTKVIRTGENPDGTGGELIFINRNKISPIGVNQTKLFDRIAVADGYPGFNEWVADKYHLQVSNMYDGGSVDPASGEVNKTGFGKSWDKIKGLFGSLSTNLSQTDNVTSPIDQPSASDANLLKNLLPNQPKIENSISQETPKPPKNGSWDKIKGFFANFKEKDPKKKKGFFSNIGSLGPGILSMIGMAGGLVIPGLGMLAPLLGMLAGGSFGIGHAFDEHDKKQDEQNPTKKKGFFSKAFSKMGGYKGASMLGMILPMLLGGPLLGGAGALLNMLIPGLFGSLAGGGASLLGMLASTKLGAIAGAATPLVIASLKSKPKPENADDQQSEMPVDTRTYTEKISDKIQSFRMMPKRETGGPVDEDVPHIVGEAGAEIFTPNKDGYVESNTVFQKQLAILESINNTLLSIDSKSEISFKTNITDFFKNIFSKDDKVKTDNIFSLLSICMEGSAEFSKLSFDKFKTFSKEVFKSSIDKISDMMETVSIFAYCKFDDFKKSAKGVIKSAVDKISDMMETVSVFSYCKFDDFKKASKDVLKSSVDKISSFISGLFTFNKIELPSIKDIGSKILSVFLTPLGWLKGIGSSISSYFKKDHSGIDITDTLSNITSSVTGFFSNTFKSVNNWQKSIRSSISESIKTNVNTFVAWSSSLKDDFSKKYGSFKQYLSDKKNDIFSLIKSPFVLMRDKFVDLKTKLTSGISSIWDKVTFKETREKLTSGFTSFFKDKAHSKWKDQNELDSNVVKRDNVDEQTFRNDIAFYVEKIYHRLGKLTETAKSSEKKSIIVRGISSLGSGINKVSSNISDKIKIFKTKLNESQEHPISKMKVDEDYKKIEKKFSKVASKLNNFSFIPNSPIDDQSNTIKEKVSMFFNNRRRNKAFKSADQLRDQPLDLTHNVTEHPISKIKDDKQYKKIEKNFSKVASKLNNFSLLSPDESKDQSVKPKRSGSSIFDKLNVFKQNKKEQKQEKVNDSLLSTLTSLNTSILGLGGKPGKEKEEGSNGLIDFIKNNIMKVFALFGSGISSLASLFTSISPNLGALALKYGPKLGIAGMLVGGAVTAIMDFVSGFKEDGVSGGLKQMFIGDKEGGIMSAVKGASKYAAAGFVAGSFFPVVGNVIGAIIGAGIGGIMGYLGSDTVDAAASWMAKYIGGAWMADMFGWEEGTYARKLAYFGSVVPYVGTIAGGLLGKQLDFMMSIFGYDGGNRKKEKSWAETLRMKFMKFAANIVSSIPVIGGFLASYFDNSYNIDEEMNDYEKGTGQTVSKDQMKLIQYGDVFDWMYSKGSGIPDMMGDTIASLFIGMSGDDYKRERIKLLAKMGRKLPTYSTEVKMDEATTNIVNSDQAFNAKIGLAQAAAEQQNQPGLLQRIKNKAMGRETVEDPTKSIAPNITPLISSNNFGGMTVDNGFTNPDSYSAGSFDFTTGSLKQPTAGPTAGLTSGQVMPLVKEYIKKNEGSGKPGKPGEKYVDSEGHDTIGYGHLIKPNEQFNSKLSMDEMNALFEKDFASHYQQASRIPGFADLDPVRQGVLTDMTFNLGLGSSKASTGLLGFKSMIKNLQEKDFNDAASSIIDSDYAKQTGNRAALNASIMRTGDPSTFTTRVPSQKVVSARDGAWYTGRGTEAIPATLHPNELVMNANQFETTLVSMAKKIATDVGNDIDTTIEKNVGGVVNTAQRQIKQLMPKLPPMSQITKMPKQAIAQVTNKVRDEMNQITQIDNAIDKAIGGLFDSCISNLESGIKNYSFGSNIAHQFF